MNKPLLGLVLGGVLGILDGLTALISAPEVAPEIAGIVIGSMAKGLVAGVIIGLVSRKVNSLPIGIVTGLIVGGLLALPIAMTNKSPTTGESYFWEILIPGAIVRYLITVTNQGNGPVDLSTAGTPTITLSDPIPTTLGTFVQGTAVTFTNGTPSSTLACAYATCVAWTKTAGGTTGFGATLTPDGAGFDDTITGIRVRPTGTFAAATAGGQPFFTIQFDARVK